MQTNRTTVTPVSGKTWTVCHTFLKWCPGGLGLLLRQKFYPFFLGACGSKVLFGRFVTIINPGRINIGEHAVINDNVVLDGGDCPGTTPAIVLEDRVFIGTGSHLRAGAGKIVIKNGSSVGSFCVVQASGPVTVDEHVLLAAFCRIGYDPAKSGNRQQEASAAETPAAEISIQSGCWLGVRSRVLPGGVIGEGTIVGAHSEVRECLPPYAVAVGVPAKVIRDRC